MNEQFPLGQRCIPWSYECGSLYLSYGLYRLSEFDLLYWRSLLEEAECNHLIARFS